MSRFARKYLPANQWTPTDQEPFVSDLPCFKFQESNDALTMYTIYLSFLIQPYPLLLYLVGDRRGCHYKQTDFLCTDVFSEQEERRRGRMGDKNC